MHPESGESPRGGLPRRTASVVVVGTSWGGVAALRTLLGDLPDDLPAAVVVAPHRRSHDDDVLEHLLELAATLPVRAIEDKMPLEPAVIYVAPSDYHTLIEPGALALSTEDRVNFSRPSIDVLFESAADAYRDRVVAVVLTGANQDGAQGAAAVHAYGGVTIAEDPETATRPEMPRAAIATGVIDHVLPLERIAETVTRLVNWAPASSSW